LECGNDVSLLTPSASIPSEPLTDDAFFLRIPSLNGLLSFMVAEEMTTGSVRSSDGDRRLFAKRSHSFNV
jgi:hypothetical protein